MNHQYNNFEIYEMFKDHHDVEFSDGSFGITFCADMRCPLCKVSNMCGCTIGDHRPTLLPMDVNEIKKTNPEYFI